jgi:hypothetical protein
MAMPGEGLRGQPLINFVCRRHADRDPIGPTITIVEGKWALCVSHANDGHEWHQIQPTRRDQIGEPAAMQDRRAG